MLLCGMSNSCGILPSLKLLRWEGGTRMKNGDIKGYQIMRSNQVTMKWRAWQCFRQIFLFSKDYMLQKLTSSFRHEARGNNHGLTMLYKDMESCGGYEDIQVMWKMLHSSSRSVAHGPRRKRVYQNFCFKPT